MKMKIAEYIAVSLVNVYANQNTTDPLFFSYDTLNKLSTRRFKPSSNKFIRALSSNLSFYEFVLIQSPNGLPGIVIAPIDSFHTAKEVEVGSESLQPIETMLETANRYAPEKFSEKPKTFNTVADMLEFVSETLLESEDDYLPESVLTQLFGEQIDKIDKCSVGDRGIYFDLSLDNGKRIKVKPGSKQEGPSYVFEKYGKKVSSGFFPSDEAALSFIKSFVVEGEFFI